MPFPSTIVRKKSPTRREHPRKSVGVSRRRHSASSLGSGANGKSGSVDQITRRNVEAISALERTSEAQRSTGERLADAFAALVGSWTFIIAQSILLAIWVVLNVIAWSYKWDPYPFILLNLA